MKPIPLLAIGLLPVAASAQVPHKIEPPNHEADANLQSSQSAWQQLVDSLRADLDATPSEPPPQAGPADAATQKWRLRQQARQQLIQALDMLVRAQNKTPAFAYRDSGVELPWNTAIITYGSKKSADLAVEYARLLQLEREKQAKAVEAQADSLAKRIAASLFDAKTARELDAPLSELSALTNAPSSGFQAQNPLRLHLSRLENLAKTWQSQLAQREAGRANEALNTLSQMESSSDALPPWISRTQLALGIERASAAAGKPTPEQFETLLRNLSEKALASAKPAELDALLLETRKLREIREHLPERGSYRVSQLESLIKTVQDYLFAKQNHQASAAKDCLARLRTGELDQVGVPRSRLLEYAYAAESAADSAGPSSSAVPRISAASPADVAARMTSLESIPQHLPALRLAVESLDNRIGSGWSFEPHTLESMAKRAAQLKAGLGLTLAVHESGLQMTSVPAIQELQRQFYILCFNVAFADDAGLPPQARESVRSYASRLKAKLAQLERWDSLQTLYTACRATKLMEPPINSDDDEALSSFLYATKLSTEAKDLRMATCAFQSVLSSPSKLIPASAVGKRLDAIRTADPKAYREGCELALNFTRAEGKRAPGERTQALQWIIPARKPR